MLFLLVSQINTAKLLMPWLLLFAKASAVICYAWKIADFIFLEGRFRLYTCTFIWIEYQAIIRYPFFLIYIYISSNRM